MKAKTDIAEKYADVIKKIKADIMKLESGTWFEMWEFLEKYRVPEEDWTDVDYEVYKLIRRQVTSPTEFIGAIVGLPFNIPRIKQKGLKSISLELSCFPYPSKERIARLEGEEVVLSYYSGEQRLFGGVPNSTSEVSQEEFLKKFYDLHIENWKKEYCDNDILDGEQWELTIDYTYKRVKIYGSNDYPDNFDELRKLLGFDKNEEDL